MALPGLYTSLAQVVLKATVPGVPDFYQGTELWDFSLVDPDNRLPVDYGVRQALLRELAPLRGEALRRRVEAALACPADGALKLLVTMRALAHRRRHRELYRTGAYVPLAVEGPRARHVVAFARVGQDGRAAVTVSGRFFAGFSSHSSPDFWSETRVLLPARLAAGRYRETIGGEITVEGGGNEKGGLPLPEIFSILPVALLEPAQP